jgi:hypothetical protein
MFGATALQLGANFTSGILSPLFLLELCQTSVFGGAVVLLSPLQQCPDLVGCNVPLSVSGFDACLGGRVLFVAS